MLRSETRRYYSVQVERRLSWTAQHEPGDFPLYDMALEVIKKDSERLHSRIKELRKTVTAKNTVLEEMEVLAEMNRPEILWTFETGEGTLK